MAAIEWDVIVIGGGFSGVSCAAEVERRMPGARVLLLEASDRLGGRARSFLPPGSGCALDLGPHYLGKDHVRAMTLARRLLREDQIFSNVEQYGPDPASRTFLEGRWRATTKKTSYLSLQGLSRNVGWEHRARIFESLLRYLALEAAVDTRAPWRSPDAAALDRMTVQDWIDAQRVPQWIKEMWGLAVLDILSIWPRQISALYWLWYNAANGGFLKIADDHRGGPQEFSLTVGLEGLLQRYASELKARILLGAPVSAIVHDGRAGVAVVTRDGARFEARRAVVAVTPNAAGRHLRFEPELTSSRQLLHAQPLGHAAKAVFVYDSPWWRDLGGYGFMSFSSGASAERAEWAMDTSHPSGSPCSLSAFISDRLLDRAGGRTEDRNLLLCEAMVEMCGDPRAARPTHVEVWDWREHRWVGGGPNTSFAPGVLSRVGDVFNRAEPPNRRLYFAAAEYSTVFPGYIEGALASGELCAAQLCWDLAEELGLPRTPRPPEAPGGAPSQLKARAFQVARVALTPAVLAANARRTVRGSEPVL